MPLTTIFNLSLAHAATLNGTQKYVLISSADLWAGLACPYEEMKPDLEEAVKKLDCPYTVILKHGLLVRTRQEIRPTGAVLTDVAKELRLTNKSLLTGRWAQDVDVVARVVARAVGVVSGMAGRRFEDWRGKGLTASTTCFHSPTPEYWSAKWEGSF